MIVARPNSISPKKLSVPINCVHKAFAYCSRISYAISTVSCLFVYIAVRFQTPIDRDIGTSIGYVQLSERYYRTHDITALTSVHQQLHCLNMSLQLFKKSSYFGNDPGDQYLLSSLFSIDTSLSLPGLFYRRFHFGYPISLLQTSLG